MNPSNLIKQVKRKQENESKWRCAVMVITTAQLRSTKPELRFCAASNPARCVSEIREGENHRQWSWPEIRLNTFRWSAILQKQFIIIIKWCRNNIQN